MAGRWAFAKRRLFPGPFNETQVEELGYWRNWLAEIAPSNKRVGHALVAFRANPPVGTKGAKLADEVIIGVGGIPAILLGVFDQEIDRLILVLGIVEPA